MTGACQKTADQPTCKQFDKALKKGEMKTMGTQNIFDMSKPRSITFLNQTPIFDWCAIRCKSKNGNWKESLKKTGLLGQENSTTLSSVDNLNRFGGLFGHLSTNRISL